MPIVRNFNLHLNAGKSIPLLIHANQYDYGEKWVFTLYNEDGTRYIPSTGAIVGIKADKKGIINTGAVEGGDVVINETQQMTAAVGKAEFELLIDDQTHGTANFFVLVEGKPGDQADMSESDLSLLQQAIDGTSAAAIAQSVTDWMDDNLTPTTPVVDSSLTVQGAAADAKKTGDEISELKSQITSNSGVPTEVKRALDTLLQNVAFKNDEGYTGELATVHNWATAVNLVSISAVFNQGQNTVYTNDSLDSLKQYLTVTASYDDSTTVVITDYTLSGTLTEGMSIISVSYGGKTSSFNVTVSVKAWMNLNFVLDDIELSDGYIDDNGNVVSSEVNWFYDEFVPAIGFWLLRSDGSLYKTSTNASLRLAEYNASNQFISRTYTANANFISAQNNPAFVKMGFTQQSTIDNTERIVACNILDTSICTIADSSINASGAVETMSGQSISDYLPIEDGYVICALNESHDSALVVFYDENHSLLSRNAVTNSLSNMRLIVPVPNGAKYVRFRCPTSPHANIYISYKA